ncbi:MAG: hypothetical protein J6386_04655 [Candidatus Synoicihabitans palmerolidicus]|nr:hypothetical protein [Candidatus Synoicihabitans palmerolidicus]MCC5022123.1 hypothetical protein [Candidatus Synoicihabitans palmerolidicus]
MISRLNAVANAGSGSAKKVVRQRLGAAREAEEGGAGMRLLGGISDGVKTMTAMKCVASLAVIAGWSFVTGKMCQGGRMLKSVVRVMAIVCSGMAGLVVMAKAAPVDYYLPEGGPYDQRVPTPEQYLGFEVGEWHLRPDQIEGYLKALVAAMPERARGEAIGRTYEQRALMQLVVAEEARLQNLDAVRQAHLAMGPVAKRPVVVNLGYSIHGNESSGANAAVMVAYWLVASEGEAAVAVRRDVVVLLDPLDPMFNPDGLARFAHWANTHRGAELVADANHREHREPWPSGRTNHYWFDLNRDWFSLVHPESRARVARFHTWRPNIMNDHHEMGTDKTFFFSRDLRPATIRPRRPRCMPCRSDWQTSMERRWIRWGHFTTRPKGMMIFLPAKGRCIRI